MESDHGVEEVIRSLDSVHRERPRVTAIGDALQCFRRNRKRMGIIPVQGVPEAGTEGRVRAPAAGP